MILRTVGEQESEKLPNEGAPRKPEMLGEPRSLVEAGHGERDTWVYG